ncbi:MAG: ATP-dependent zinc metalloprotease FtsH 4 [Candidatus Thorarchaeota archaeon]|nr:MAG: ATP-dependent zinc metalloprotease FtsH 4 [Candidatus Thorarchaeota archaeon]
MGEDDSFIEMVRLIAPENLSLDRISQRSLINYAEQYARTFRRAIEMKDQLEELDLQFGGRVLLIGPPGTDFETFITYLATEIPLKVVQLQIKEIISQEERVPEFIRFMREYAERNAPCILYIERIEVLGSKDTSDAVILESEIGQLNWDNAEVIVVASTHEPQNMDTSIRTVFDRAFITTIPNSDDRMAALESILKDRKDLDLTTISEFTEGWSFADIKKLGIALLMTEPATEGQIDPEELEKMIGDTHVLPISNPDTLKYALRRTKLKSESRIQKAVEAYPDDFLEQLYLMAVGDNYQDTQRIIESLNTGLPLSPKDQEFLGRYPFLLSGTPEERLTQLLKAKKSHDRLSRIMGR